VVWFRGSALGLLFESPWFQFQPGDFVSWLRFLRVSPILCRQVTGWYLIPLALPSTSFAIHYRAIWCCIVWTLRGHRSATQIWSHSVWLTALPHAFSFCTLLTVVQFLLHWMTPSAVPGFTCMSHYFFPVAQVTDSCCVGRLFYVAPEFESLAE
jgi:hypothetical protein